jgi:hypothetical protein
MDNSALQGYARTWELVKVAKTVCARTEQEGMMKQAILEQEEANLTLAPITEISGESPSHRRLDDLDRRVDKGLELTGLKDMFRLHSTSKAELPQEKISKNREEALERRLAKQLGTTPKKVVQYIENIAGMLDKNDVRLEEVQLVSMSVNDRSVKPVVRALRTNERLHTLDLVRCCQAKLI